MVGACKMCRVGQNHVYNIYGILGREIIKYIRSHTVLANPKMWPTASCCAWRVPCIIKGGVCEGM